MSGGKIVEGIFAVNKPPSITSAQVLRELQRVFNGSRVFAAWLAAQEAMRARESQHQRRRRRRGNKPEEVKIGHGGTLDPMATGVLIVGVGAGTKGLGNFLECTKSYDATILFGATSDTYDITGKLLGRAQTADLSKDKIESALNAFRGSIMQRPPMYSALRVQGKKLYEYAREGKELPVDIKDRTVRVDELSLSQWLESEQHDFHWPLEEADSEEKVVAAKLEGNPNSAVDEGQVNSSLKRKRSEEPDPLGTNDIEAPSEAKAAKVEAEDSKDEAKMTAESEASQINTGAESTKPSQSQKPNSKTRVQYSPRPNDLGAKADAPAAKISMTVSSGFYVRSLCHDLGKAVGSLGLMASLVRTRQAEYELGKNVIEYDDFQKGEDVWGPKVESMLEEWKSKGNKGAS